MRFVNFTLTLILLTSCSQGGEEDWKMLKTWLKCQVLISEGSVKTDPEGIALLVREGIKICPYGEGKEVLLKTIVTLSDEDVLLIGHGGVEGGEDTFDGGSYLSYAGVSAGEVGILSCRGLPGKEPLYSREILPHREAGVWVWGKRGYKVGAQIYKQWHAFKRQAEVWKALAPVRK